MPKKEKTQAENPSANHVRLPALEAPPEGEVLHKMLKQASDERGKLIELPWTIADGLESFSLTVQYDKTTDNPIWTLYQGKGTNSSVIWSCTEADLELISDVIYMFCSTSEKSLVKKEGESLESDELVSSKAVADTIPVDYESLKQKANVLLGYMLVEAGLLTEPILDEALKLQELVRNESLTVPQAIDALKRANSRLIPDNEPTVEHHETEPQTSHITSIESILQFLKQAGIITDADIASVGSLNDLPAEVDRKLFATGKIDKLTLEAAKAGWPMVQANQLRPEQAIITLHYCIRSRVSFKDALSELGFEVTRI